MLFRNNRIIELVLLILVLIFISTNILIDILLDILYGNVIIFGNILLFIIPLFFARHLFDSYEIDEKNIIVKKFLGIKKIPLDSIEHIRRVYSLAEENIKDRTATYLIADGDNYRTLNRFAKNKDGLSLIDVLIDDHQIPIINEKTTFFVKTRIKK